MKRYFIIADLMGSGTYNDLNNMFKMLRLQDTIIDCVWEYETFENKFHGWDLDGKLAIIAFASLTHENKNEIVTRLEKLKGLGFKFAVDLKWEGAVNGTNILKSNDVYNELSEQYDLGIISGAVNEQCMYLPWFWYYLYTKHKGKNYHFNHSFKTFDFLYLNKQQRYHRDMLFDTITDRGLLNNSLYSYHDKNIELNKKYEFKQFQDKSYPRYGMDQDIFELPYNDSAVSIVCETSVSDKEVFITEKIYKAIIAGHVFVLLGNPGTLQKLNDQGFLDLPGVDTSYDQTTNLEKRITSVTNLCEELKNMDYGTLYTATEAIRNQNRQNFFNEDNLSSELQKGWLTFLEFINRS